MTLRLRKHICLATLLLTIILFSNVSYAQDNIHESELCRRSKALLVKQWKIIRVIASTPSDATDSDILRAKNKTFHVTENTMWINSKAYDIADSSCHSINAANFATEYALSPRVLGINSNIITIVSIEAERQGESAPFGDSLIMINSHRVVVTVGGTFFIARR